VNRTGSSEKRCGRSNENWEEAKRSRPTQTPRRDNFTALHNAGDHRHRSGYVCQIVMELRKQIEAVFQPLIGRKVWGASIGWGSFATLEFGRRRLSHHHYHGEWHLWLYQCDWQLYSRGRLLADSESKKRLMQLAIDNLNGEALTQVDLDPQKMATEFTFGQDLRLICKAYSDAVDDEECWMLFLPDRQVVSLLKSGLHRESQESKPERSLSQQ
jgi:hypothetical protein